MSTPMHGCLDRKKNTCKKNRIVTRFHSNWFVDDNRKIFFTLNTYSIAYKFHYLSTVLFNRDIIRISFVTLKFNRRSTGGIKGMTVWGSSGGEREWKEREREKKFAEKCEGLFWRPCGKHSFFPLTFPLSSRSNPLLEGISPSSVDVPWKIPVPPLNVGENFLFPSRSRVEDAGGRRGGGGTNASNDFPLKLPVGCWAM